MLVLSRKLEQRILLPSLNVAVQVVGIKAGAVRLGIDAPPEVAVLREELRDPAGQWAPADASPAARPAQQSVDPLTAGVCDWLRHTATGLGLLQLQLEAGHLADAKAGLARLREEFQLLRLGVEGELEQPRPRTPAGQRKTPRALLVEDDRIQRELLASCLRLAGVEVDTAGDGCDALDRLRSGSRPDVVLLDMAMPRCDGPTTVRTIRRDPAYAGLKIFAVSGHRPDEFDLESGPAGIDRWFHKPVDPTTLVRDMARVTGDSLCRV
jgi:carbon storage regulator CsrA